MARLVIVSNRVALPSDPKAKAGGLAVALAEALACRGGMWFGWSGKVKDGAQFDPAIVEDGRITYATFDLSPRDHQEFYLDYANASLWPLFHYRLDGVGFHRSAYEGYVRVNERVACALAPHVGPDDVVWIHDYHFLLLPGALRRLGVRCRIGFFLHTPFPPPEIMAMAPQDQDLARGLFHADLIGLQTANDVRALHRYVADELGGSVNADGTCAAFGRRCRVAAYPIGIDVAAFALAATQSSGSPMISRMRRSLGDKALILGVDRLDYSKGLPHKVEAFAALLESHAEHRGAVTFMQVAPVSRGQIPHYRDLRREMERAAGRVNGRFGEVGWVPVHYLNRGLDRAALAGLYRIARVGLVTPLRDGMNLVAKEFVAAQNPDDPGVLVLSRFAGAARELSGAVIVNPYDSDGTAAGQHEALVMPLADRRARMADMMATLKSNTIGHWRDRFLADLTRRAATTAHDGMAAR